MSQNHLGICPVSKPSALRTKQQRLKRKKVLKMLAVMEAQQAAGPSNISNSAPPTTSECTAAPTKEFLSSGRTGRRNALPDILGEHALVTSSDLPARLETLTTGEPVAGSSKEDHKTDPNAKDS